MGTSRTGIVLGYLGLGGCWALRLHLSLIIALALRLEFNLKEDHLQIDF